MSLEERCETHVWTSLGVVDRDGTVCRIWEYESHPVWAAERFDADDEREWDTTRFADR